MAKAKNCAEKEHQDDAEYVKRPEENFTEDYTSKTAKRLFKHMLGHDGKDNNSHLVKYSFQ